MGILCYHTVDDQFRSRLSLTPAQFEEHCRWLVADRDVVDLATALDLVDDRGRLPRGTVALTFDDGLEGLYRYAYPTLVRHGLPATVFMVTDTLTGDHPHVDWVDGTPPGVLRAMTLEQMLEMAGDGIEFGSHSSRHLHLPRLGPKQCLEDLVRSRHVLEEALGVPVQHLAYPRGQHDRTVRVATESAGFSHGLGLPEAREVIGSFSVPRVGVYAHNSLPTVRLKASRGYLPVRMSHAYPVARGVVRAARRAGAPARRRSLDEGGEQDRLRTETSAPSEVRAGPIAYMMSRFPKVSETFVLYEILEMQRQGVDVRVYPLLRERQPVEHPEARALVERARFQPFVSPAILRSGLHYLRRRPAACLRMVWDVLRGTAGSANFFVGALGILPKTVHMARLMEQEGVSHVHSHFASHPALAGLIIHRLTGIPFSFTAHGSDLHVERRMLGQKVAEAAFVVAISEYNRQMILDHSAPEHHHKVHVLHCGVDLETFVEMPSPPDDLLRVVCVGTLHEVKGQAHLVDAIAELRRRGVKVRARFVGDGPDLRALARRVRKEGLTGQVELLGPLPRHQVAREIADAHVLVAPSVPTANGKREGIPVVLMEAMAMGRPVVASDLSGIPELVEHDVCGMLVPPGDVRSLASALEALAADPGCRERMGSAGRRVVEESFALHDTTARLAGLIGVGAQPSDGTPGP